MIPNAAHGYGDAANYMTRRRWDYFVRNLLGLEPPKDYRLGRRIRRRSQALNVTAPRRSALRDQSISDHSPHDERNQHRHAALRRNGIAARQHFECATDPVASHIFENRFDFQHVGSALPFGARDELPADFSCPDTHVTGDIRVHHGGRRANAGAVRSRAVSET